MKHTAPHKSVLVHSRSKSKAKPRAARSTASSPGQAQQSLAGENAAAKRKKSRQGEFALKDLTYPDQRIVRFPIVRGKKTEAVELLTSAHYHHVSIEFADRTSLSFGIEPGFKFMAAYDYFKKGKPRAKLWPEIASHRDEPDRLDRLDRKKLESNAGH